MIIKLSTIGLHFLHMLCVSQRNAATNQWRIQGRGGVGDHPRRLVRQDFFTNFWGKYIVDVFLPTRTLKPVILQFQGINCNGLSSSVIKCSMKLHKITNYKLLADHKFDVSDLQQICQRGYSLFLMHV